MRWRPKEKQPRNKWRFPFFPLVMDDGLRVMWEWVHYKITITREWGGMGADGCEGYIEYWAKSGYYLGKRSFKS